MRKTILILLSILTFYGCRYNVPPSVKEALSTAEAYMEENPDSALHILQNISHPENLRSQARADYALLYTQACDRLIFFLRQIRFCYPKFRITEVIQTKILSQLDFLLY